MSHYLPKSRWVEVGIYNRRAFRKFLARQVPDYYESRALLTSEFHFHCDNTTWDEVLAWCARHDGGAW